MSQQKLDKAIELIPDRAETYFGRDISFLNLDNFEQIIASHDKAIKGVMMLLAESPTR